MQHAFIPLKDVLCNIHEKEPLSVHRPILDETLHAMKGFMHFSQNFSYIFKGSKLRVSSEKLYQYLI